jgi:acetyl-CoA acyltransferase
MRDAVIVAAVRTPIGRRNGALSGVHPVDLSATVLRALVDRTGLDPVMVDDVVWGCVSQVGEQTFNVGRSAVLAAGWPQTVPAVTLDRQCGSSQQAMAFAAAGLISGQYDVAVAGGVESMSRVALGSSASVSGLPFGAAVLDRYAEELAAVGTPVFNQGVGAELIAQRWGFTRTQLDEFALESHELAAAAIDEGRFRDQIVPVTTPEGAVVSVDEGVRRGGSVAALAGLRTPFLEGGVITAASSSQISDGAAALLMTTSEAALALGLTPLARVHTTVVVGSDPVIMLTGPIPATAKVLDRAGLTLSDVAVAEVNEAFASVPLAWLADTGADRKQLNVNGGAIALGHPLGASGARLATTLVHQLLVGGGRYGLQTMCEGGGMANATVLENLTPAA